METPPHSHVSMCHVMCACTTNLKQNSSKAAKPSYIYSCPTNTSFPSPKLHTSHLKPPILVTTEYTLQYVLQSLELQKTHIFCSSEAAQEEQVPCLNDCEEDEVKEQEERDEESWSRDEDGKREASPGEPMHHGRERKASREGSPAPPGERGVAREPLQESAAAGC